MASNCIRLMTFGTISQLIFSICQIEENSKESEKKNNLLTSKELFEISCLRSYFERLLSTQSMNTGINVKVIFQEGFFQLQLFFLQTMKISRNISIYLFSYSFDIAYFQICYGLNLWTQRQTTLSYLYNSSRGSRQPVRYITIMNNKEFYQSYSFSKKSKICNT